MKHTITNMMKGGAFLFLLVCAPIFYIATGFLIDPLVFIPSIIDNFSLASAIIIALVAGKWIAAEIAGSAFKYTPAARLTMWSLTLPQVATTLAATLVAFNTFNPLHQRLIDDRMLQWFSC